MKRIIIAALVVLALGVTGCSVSTGSDGFTPDPGVQLPEDDPTNPFEIEPVEETDDGIVVEDDDPVVDEENDPIEPENDGIFEMQTEADDVLTEGTMGASYEQTFRMVDKNIDYSWSVTGLPENTGLALEEDADSWRYSLRGTPVLSDVGTHQIIISVVDADSNSTSISFELTVASGMGTLHAVKIEDPCKQPLRIVVEGFGGHVDNQVLANGKFRAKLGSKANIKLKAVRGGLLLSTGSSKGIVEVETGMPVGKVTWTVESKVRNGRHCRYIPREGGLGDHDNHGGNSHDDDEYNYSWTPVPGSCEGRGGPDERVEERVTMNPTWQTMKSISLAGDDQVKAEGNVLNLSGKMLYDGPLPVKNLPLDEEAVELIEVTVTDECSVGGDLKVIAQKTLEIGIAYPVNGEGGRIEDVKVKMRYEDIAQYWHSGYTYDNPHLLDRDEPGAPPEMNVDCDDYEFEPICESSSKFVMLFTDGDGLSGNAWDKFEADWNLLPAIKDSLGYVFYDFEVCDESDDTCRKRMIDHTNVVGQSSSIRDVQQVFLMWVAPPRLQGPDTVYADFDIERIKFYNKYWYAEFEDELNDFDNNITKDFVRSSCLTNRTRFPGMSAASRLTNNSGYRGVFRRRELAGYIPDTE